MPNSGRWGTSSWTSGWAAFPRPLLIVAAIVTVICILGIIYFAGTYSVVTSNVCMSFNSRTECRTAIGVTRDVARSAAVRSACAALTSGRRDLAACVQSSPTSVSYR